MARQRNRGVSGNRPQRIAAQSDHTILHVDADGVERIAIAHAIVLQLLHNFLLQLGVGDLAGAGNLQLVTNRNYVLDPVRYSYRSLLWWRSLDRAFQIDDSILNRYLYILKFLSICC